MPGFIDGMGGLRGCGSGEIDEGDEDDEGDGESDEGVAAATCSCTLCQPIHTDRCEACEKRLTARTVLLAGPGFVFPTADVAQGRQIRPYACGFAFPCSSWCSKGLRQCSMPLLSFSCTLLYCSSSFRYLIRSFTNLTPQAHGRA